ncbi:hypothetical protein BH23CHL2_BH23CHL2_33560 [soil metagenome]
MSSDTTIRELMHDADNLMGADEPVRNARPQFDLETARSLILIDQTGPIGLLTRSQMRKISDEQMSLPARDFMVPVPMLQQTQTVAEARQELTEITFDADRIPVVNDDRRFVGVVNREAILRDGESFTTDHGTVRVNGEVNRSFQIQSGMNVRGAEGEKLGKIDEIIVERDAVASFTIEHGLLGRRHKRVKAEHVANLDDDAVYLNFGKREFKFLADVEALDPDEAAATAK